MVNEMQEEIDSYWEERPDATYEQLQERFGRPEELAASLIDSLTSDTVLRLFRVRRWRSITLVVLSIVMVSVITVSVINLTEKDHEIPIIEESVIYRSGPMEDGE
jgi:hypothetical protein